MLIATVLSIDRDWRVQLIVARMFGGEIMQELPTAIDSKITTIQKNDY
jgi:hypothetical protein